MGIGLQKEMRESLRLVDESEDERKREGGKGAVDEGSITQRAGRHRRRDHLTVVQLGWGRPYLVAHKPLSPWQLQAHQTDRRARARFSGVKCGGGCAARFERAGWRIAVA